MKITKQSIDIKNVSEVGVARGLVAWYPLIGDTKDYAGTNHATNNGAVATAEGYEFDGVDDRMVISQPDVEFSPNVFTISLKITPESSGYFICPKSSGVDQFLGYDAGAERVRLTMTERSDINGRSISSPAGSVPVGQTTHVAFQIDGMLTRVFVGGGLVAEVEQTLPIANWVGSWHIGQRANGTYRFGGIIGDLRIHNVALTPEEVALQAKLALGEINSAITSDCLYIKGQLKEVIA